MKITDEAVEAAAEAIYYERQTLNPESPRWSDIPEGDESEKDWYRDEARSALVAAVPFLSTEEVVHHRLTVDGTCTCGFASHKVRSVRIHITKANAK